MSEFVSLYNCYSQINDIQVQQQSCATDTTSHQFDAYTLNPVEGIIEKSDQDDNMSALIKSAACYSVARSG